MSALIKASMLLLDTGPLLALVNRRDRNHTWIRGILAGNKGRLVSCEAVISEAWFLAQSRLSPPSSLLALLERLPLEIIPAWGSHTLDLVRRYADLPMDVSDSCLVALAEDAPESIVVTTDKRDFSLYRMHGKEPVPVLLPDM
jgi:predicted nucleic acid-binding protein